VEKERRAATYAMGLAYFISSKYFRFGIEFHEKSAKIKSR